MTSNLLQIVSFLTIIISATKGQQNEAEEEQQGFASHWIFMMVGFGFVGVIFMAVIGVHSVYNFYKQDLHAAPVRLLYIVFFTSYLVACFAYAFLRTDLILPMGTRIPCRVGYYVGTNGVYLSKISLLTIFLLRIDLAFHSSALGYPRKALFIFWLICAIEVSGLNGIFMYVTWDLVKHVTDTYQTPVSNDHVIGMCTTGTTADPYYTYTLGCLALSDFIQFSIVCGLFVYKLHKVVQMSKEHDSCRLTSSADQERNNKLIKLMKKQTILVIIACLSSLLVMGLGAVETGFSLLIAMDAIINTLCVWFMFVFADSIWNKLVSSCCCCCHCCDQQQFLMTLRSLRQSIHNIPHSLRSDSKTRPIVNKDSTSSTGAHHSPRMQSKSVPSTSHNALDIIDFKNAKNITSLNNIKEDQTCVIQMAEDVSNENGGMADSNSNNETYIPHTHSAEIVADDLVAVGSVSVDKNEPAPEMHYSVDSTRL